MSRPGPIAQMVVSTNADIGVASSILARSHTFMEIGHEIIPTVPLIQEGLLSFTIESICTKDWLSALSSLPRKKVWLGELTILT